MRLIQSSRQWGNMYRHRFYINGKRVTECVFDLTLGQMNMKQEAQRKMENKTGFYRLIWESK